MKRKYLISYEFANETHTMVVEADEQDDIEQVFARFWNTFTFISAQEITDNKEMREKD